MRRQSFDFITWLFFLTFCLSSCMTKKYYYLEDGGHEQVIEADSDSAAYLKAFEYFQISKKVYTDMKKSYTNSTLAEPISFDLLNDKRENITYKVSFVQKDSFEQAYSNDIKILPNNFEDSKTRSIEERNGVGAKYDTAGLHLSPVKILSAKFVSKEYSNYKDIRLTYKNVSGKKISAIRFKWYGENAFNEPADMSGLVKGWGGGFSDDVLRPGATDYGTWNILSRDGKKVLIAYPYEVAFEDGTKWILPNN